MEPDQGYVTEKVMQDRELIELMFIWQDNQARADDAKRIVEAEIMRRKKTFKAGSVTAAYSAGRSNYLWQETAIIAGATDETIKPFSTTTTNVVTTTDWKAVAESLNVTKLSCKRSVPVPKATLKLLTRK